MCTALQGSAASFVHAACQSYQWPLSENLQHHVQLVKHSENTDNLTACETVATYQFARGESNLCSDCLRRALSNRQFQVLEECAILRKVASSTWCKESSNSVTSQLPNQAVSIICLLHLIIHQQLHKSLDYLEACCLDLEASLQAVWESFAGGKQV